MIDQELDLVGTAFADVRLDGDARDVISRGRTLRRRRKAVPVLATAGILAASLSLAAVTQSSPASVGSHALSYNGSVVNVDEAGFSIHTDVQTGTVTVTVRQLFDQAELEALLAKAGVRAVFHTSTLTAASDIKRSAICTWTGVRTLPSAGVVSQQKLGGSITISPANMPAESVLGIQYLTIEPVSGGPGRAEGVVEPTLLSGEPTGCVSQ